MFCPMCNPEYKDANKKLVRKDPGRHMTSGFVGTDHKKYLKCTFCGFQELDPDAEQPPDVVDGHKLLELNEVHDRLTVSHEKLKADNLTLNQDLKAAQAEVAKLRAAQGLPTAPSGVAPGAQVVGSEYPKLLRSPVTKPTEEGAFTVLQPSGFYTQPDVEVHDAAEEAKARADGFTIIVQPPPIPKKPVTSATAPLPAGAADWQPPEVGAPPEPIHPPA